MAYQVNNFNGTFLTSVADGTIDSTTDLRFVGKNYAGYGEVQNENYLHLMEHFANTTQPPKAVTGQIWYDSANKKLKFYNETDAKWKVAGGAEVAATAPSGLAIGEFWWDSSAKQLYAYTGTDFILVGPAASPDLGTSSVIAQVVKDTLNSSHTILKFIAGGTTTKTIAIVSQDEFTLNSGVNPITGFTLIKKGITLINTNSSGVGSSDELVWGTASNSLRLGGVLATQFLQRGENSFTSGVNFATDAGITIGVDSDIRLWIDPNAGALIENQIGETITVRITNPIGSIAKDVAVFSDTGITPSQTSTYDLGTTSSIWRNIYATTVAANLVGNITGNSTGNHIGNLIATDSTVMINGSSKEIGYAGAILRGTLFGNVQGNLTGNSDNASKLGENSPSVTLPSTADKSSIPVRSTDGDITARKFIGTSNSADQLLVGAIYRSSSTSADINTIAVRDSAGDIYGSIFQGTAAAARYADLAEKYLPDAEYAPGTVMCIGGNAEVTASMLGNRAIGVISTNPAYMMNKDLEGGVYVALKGRVPCKVVGCIKKGDELVASNDGCAIIAAPHASGVFAVALESSDDEGAKVIEVLVL